MDASEDDELALVMAKAALKVAPAKLAIQGHPPVFMGVVPGLVQLELGGLFNRKSAIGALTFLETEVFAHEVLVAAFYLGAALYASATRNGRAPAQTTAVSLSVFYRWSEELQQEGSKASARLNGAVRSAAVLARAIGYVASSLDEQVAVWAKKLRQSPNEIFGIATRFAYRGYQSEFILSAAAAEQAEDADALRVLTSRRATPESLALLKSLDPAETANIHAWPLDTTCICGADLKQYAFCCDADLTVDVASECLVPGYRITCSKCGDENGGFRCDSCHRAHTWDLGVVPTHKPSMRA